MHWLANIFLSALKQSKIHLYSYQNLYLLIWINSSVSHKIRVLVRIQNNFGTHMMRKHMCLSQSTDESTVQWQSLCCGKNTIPDLVWWSTAVAYIMVPCVLHQQVASSHILTSTGLPLCSGTNCKNLCTTKSIQNTVSQNLHLYICTNILKPL